MLQDVSKANLMKIYIAQKIPMLTGRWEKIFLHCFDTCLDRICVTLKKTKGETVKHVDGSFVSMQVKVYTFSQHLHL